MTEDFECGSWNAEWGSRNAEWGSWNAEWGSWNLEGGMVKKRAECIKLSGVNWNQMNTPVLIIVKSSPSTDILVF
jgi:hypothetical protein